MVDLSPTGAKILRSQHNGTVMGHPAALDRLRAQRLITRAKKLTAAGWRVHAELVSTGAPAEAAVPALLPARAHDAVLAAACRPDQLLPGADDVCEPVGRWFSPRTLAQVRAAGYATHRPTSWDRDGVDDGARRALYLTAAGRSYANTLGGHALRRRRITLIACGELKEQPDQTDGDDSGIPAGDLYIGHYHRSLRSAANALTDQTLIYVISALHGIVPLDKKLKPYNMSPDDEGAITADAITPHSMALGLGDADVIFLGGKKYADLLTPSVPHLYAPLSGGLGEHRGLCKQARGNSALREAWWATAAELHETHHGK